MGVVLSQTPEAEPMICIDSGGDMTQPGTAASRTPCPPCAGDCDCTDPVNPDENQDETPNEQGG